MAPFSKAVSQPLRNLRDKAKKHFTCPKCGHSPDDVTNPPTFPVGTSAELLLDSSPTPQLLLSESNTIVYANRSATHLLRAVSGKVAVELDETSAGTGTQTDDVQIPDGKRHSVSIADSNESKDDSETASVQSGLCGYTIDQLNIEISDKDMRRWITFIQVFENIKTRLARRQAKTEGKDMYKAEMYGEDPKYNRYDYYGDLERLAKRNGVDPDKTLRDTCTVSIEREDGATVEAMMYVTLIDPHNTGYSYSSISLVPTGQDLDAGFSPIGKKKRTRRRDKFRSRLSGQYRQHDPDCSDSGRSSPASVDDYSTGQSGEDLLERIAHIKDLILDEMDYCFIALSPDGDIVITNKATKAILGEETLRASTGEGFEWIARLDIWRPDFSERLPFEEWTLNSLLTHHKPLSRVIGVRAGDKKLVLELRGKCIWEDPEKQEGLLAALAVVVDQTSWFAHEKSMKTAQMKQGYFLSNISQALKTPVSGIVGLLELLYSEGGTLNDDQRNWVRQIFGSVNQLLLVVNDIIDFNRIEAGDVVVTRQTFVLQDLIDELKTLFTGSMAHKGVKFEVDTSKLGQSAFGDGSRLVLVGDDEKIKRSCINLLSNAFKFTVKGKVTFAISTYAVRRNVVDIRFEIRDTGTGISNNDLKKLFIPLDEMTPESARILADQNGGTGIGLSIAQKFVSLLGGTLGCESVVDAGSTFWFIVPCGRPPPDQPPVFGPKKMTLSSTMGLVISSHELERDPNTPVEAKEAKVLIEGTRVMLVEDNWATQVVMEKRLTRLGCEVIMAVNGQNALNILKRPGTDVDLIFISLQISLLDGFEATRLIRTDPSLAKWKNTPIIGVTATEVKGDAEKAKTYGLDEYVLKPITDEILEGIISRVMDPIALGMRRKRDSGVGELSGISDLDIDAFKS